MPCLTEFCPTRVKVKEAEKCNKGDYTKHKWKKYIPVTIEQLYCCGAGTHLPCLLQVAVLAMDGTYPRLHWKVIVTPSLVWG